MVNGASSHMTKEGCSWYVALVVYVNMCVSLYTPILGVFLCCYHSLSYYLEAMSLLTFPISFHPDLELQT